MLALVFQLGDPRGESFSFRVCQSRVDCHGCIVSLGNARRVKQVYIPRMEKIAMIALTFIIATLQTAGAQVAPIGAYHVVPELPGMGRAVDTAVAAARRRALLRRIGRGTVVIPAAHARDIEVEVIQDNDFRQDNTFFYLTQLETQDAWLLLSARGPDSLETVLFLPPRTPARERWTGLRLGPDSVAVRVAGIRTVLPIDSLENRLVRARFAGPRPIY